MEVRYLEELQGAGVEFSHAGDEVKMRCPFHEDNVASCSLNLVKEQFYCHACSASGGAVKLLSKILDRSRAETAEYLSTKYGLEQIEKTIDPVGVDKFHEELFRANYLRRELYKRCVDDAIIKRYKLGVDQDRITIPIKSASGAYVNIRKYLPGAKTRKFTNLRGRGQLRLYPIDQLEYDKLLLCGGEIKALAAIPVVNPIQMGAISTTGGEGKWEESWDKLIKGKTLYVCMDIDEAGCSAAEALCRRLRRHTKKIYLVRLPLDIGEYPKGDLNDFLAADLNLIKLLEEAPIWQEVQTIPQELTPPVEKPLTEACSADSWGTRVKVRGVVSAIKEERYLLPKEVQAVCNRSQQFCGHCPVYGEKEDKVYTLYPESEHMLCMLDAKAKAKRESIIEAMRIPSACSVVQFREKSKYNVRDLRIGPELDIGAAIGEQTMVPAITVDTRTELNEVYSLEGSFVAHPNTQHGWLIISKASNTRDALMRFKLRDAEADKLRLLFSCKPGKLNAKLDDIYNDLSHNVTGIYGRKDLHIAIDLAYHSAIGIHEPGKETKGWVEILIVGDSSQGKSEAANTLRRHYSLGEKVDCKNATVAGLLGGMQQLGSGWFTTWGTIPSQDRRLVILEELSGAHEQVFSKLTEMRSSGIAELTKIGRGRAHARTRLIALSNAKEAISSYGQGILAIRTVLPALEDIRRFDACLILNRNEIPESVISNGRDISIPHKYTSKMCRKLILWIWSLNPEQVIFHDTECIYDASKRLCAKFSEDIPLIDRGSMSQKIKRLSVAVAARVFSADEDLNCVVYPEHVDWVTRWLDRVYSSEVHGYLEYSNKQVTVRRLVSEAAVSKCIATAPTPNATIEQLLRQDAITDRFITTTFCASDLSETTRVIHTLVSNNALVHRGNEYRKTEAFVEYLRNLRNTKFNVNGDDFDM